MGLLDEIMIETILSRIKHQFEAIVGREYYLYRKSDNSYFISMIEPEYWNIDKFKLELISKVIYNQDGIWDH